MKVIELRIKEISGEGFNSLSFTNISEEQKEDIEFISMFLRDSYEKSFARKVIHLLNRLYNRFGF